jgi:hypothetical protein
MKRLDNRPQRARFTWLGLLETGRPGLLGRLDDHARGIARAIEDA